MPLILGHIEKLTIPKGSPAEITCFFCRCLQKLGEHPQNGWFISWKTLSKWMIWGAHPFFWKHPYTVDDLREANLQKETVGTVWENSLTTKKCHHIPILSGSPAPLKIWMLRDIGISFEKGWLDLLEVQVDH